MDSCAEVAASFLPVVEKTDHRSPPQRPTQPLWTHGPPRPCCEGTFTVPCTPGTGRLHRSVLHLRSNLHAGGTCCIDSVVQTLAGVCKTPGQAPAASLPCIAPAILFARQCQGPSDMHGRCALLQSGHDPVPAMGAQSNPVLGLAGAPGKYRLCRQATVVCCLFARCFPGYQTKVLACPSCAFCPFSPSELKPPARVTWSPRCLSVDTTVWDGEEGERPPIPIARHPTDTVMLLVYFRKGSCGLLCSWFRTLFFLPSGSAGWGQSSDHVVAERPVALMQSGITCTRSVAAGGEPLPQRRELIPPHPPKDEGQDGFSSRKAGSDRAVGHGRVVGRQDLEVRVGVRGAEPGSRPPGRHEVSDFHTPRLPPGRGALQSLEDLRGVAKSRRSFSCPQPLLAS